MCRVGGQGKGFELKCSAEIVKGDVPRVVFPPHSEQETTGRAVYPGATWLFVAFALAKHVEQVSNVREDDEYVCARVKRLESVQRGAFRHRIFDVRRGRLRKLSCGRTPVLGASAERWKGNRKRRA